MQGRERRTVGPRRLIVDLSLKVLAAAAILPAVGATPDPLRLPLRIVRNNPVTSIEVAGHEIRIGVDTGGGMLGLTREALTQAGAVELAGEPIIWTDANGQEHEARRFRVPQIRVGGRQFTNLDAIEAEAVPNGPAAASVLGRAFLKQFVVIIDYPGRMMILLDPAVPDVEAESMGCKGTRVPFEESSEADLVVTRVKMDGATVRLGWDTGASYSALRTGVATVHQLPVTPAVGQKPPFYDTKSLIIGGSDFGPLEFAVLPLGIPSDLDGVLGYNVFAKHIVCLHYGRKEVLVR
jgi:hypothetical protein